jgi:hypothetical protein
VHTGANLRNRLAHGLGYDAVFLDSFPYHAAYLWWLSLRLVIVTFLSAQPHPSEEGPSEAEDSSSQEPAGKI